MIRMEAAALEASGGTLITVYGGTSSIGFQTVPLSCSTVTGLILSFEDTEIVLKTCPLKLALLNWIGTSPVLPGSTLWVHSPAAVQPQEGCTCVISRVSFPVLVKTKVYFTNSPDW